MSIVRDAADIGGTANQTDEGCCLNGKTGKIWKIKRYEIHSEKLKLAHSHMY